MSAHMTNRVMPIITNTWLRVSMWSQALRASLISLLRCRLKVSIIVGQSCGMVEKFNQY